MKSIVLLLLGCFTPYISIAASPSGFDTWLDALKQEALQKGISAKTVAIALDDVSFKERVVASDRKQAEFTESYDDYLRKRVSEWRIDRGQKYMVEHGDVMTKVTGRYGVPARVVAAILGVETNYGTFELPHAMFDVLATLAYDTRRGARFRKEVFAALTILDKGYATPEQLKSSWAGALGIPQFMPSTYLQFAVDHDGDGTKNIWQHGPDLYASVANYLSHYGWDNNETWARKVILPEGNGATLAKRKKNLSSVPQRCERYKKHLQGWKLLKDWNQLGVRRMNYKPLPAVALPASLIVTSDDQRHGYLVYGNFCSLMRYNPSFKYALTVGSLSDQLKSKP